MLDRRKGICPGTWVLIGYFCGVLGGCVDDVLPNCGRLRLLSVCLDLNLNPPPQPLPPTVKCSGTMLQYPPNTHETCRASLNASRV